MLTGVDTVADAFTVTAHRHGGRPALVGMAPATTWAVLGGTVRLLTLGLGSAGVGKGSRVHPAVRDPVDRLALELALACVGAVRIGASTPGRPGAGAGAVAVLSDEDLGPLRAAGASVDESDPDHFERRTRSVDGDAPGLEDDIATWTQRQLLWAARSLAASLGATADDRVLSTLPPGGATGWVCGALLPVVSGAAAAVAPESLRAGVEAVRPTLLVCGDEDVGRLGGTGLTSPPRAWRRTLASLAGHGSDRPPGLERCRAALVVGDGTGAARLAAAGVPARVAATWPGHAGLVTGAAGPLGGLGRPLPGVTIGIDDDGEVLVRSESVADGWCEDGWLHTGWTGEIDAAGRLSAVAGTPGGDR